MNYNKKYWDQRYSDMGGKRTVGKHNWSDEQYEKFIQEHSDSLKECLQDHTKKGMVVDIGCGIGRWIPLLESVYDKYLGADISSQAIKEASVLYPQKSFMLIDDYFQLKITVQTIWTHVVLQHIIDDGLLRLYAERFFENIDEEGTVVITESCKEVQTRNHYMAHRSYHDYKSLFEDVGFITIHHQEYIPDHHTLVFKKEVK